MSASNSWAEFADIFLRTREAQRPMTSLRQIEANRHNALKSTGPKTEYGKQRSRRNALRHGFTA